MLPIIGAGPIGLLIGNLLLDKGIETIIYEEDNVVGEPQHCTGIVSMSTLDLYPVSKKKIISKKLYGVKIVISEFIHGEFRSSVPKAVVLNRKMLEEELSYRFVDKGGKLILGNRINSKIMRKRSEWLINAGGVKELIKAGYREVLPALQLDIEVENSSKRDLALIYVDKSLNPLYFSWVTPINEDDVLRIGTASIGNTEVKIKGLIEKIIRREGKKINVLGKLGGHIITGGPRKKFINENIIFVGDSAGMTKISTGGGLNYGAIGAHILSEIIDRKGYSEYRSLWMKRFKREIVLQQILRELFLKVEDRKLAEIYSILSKKEVLNQLFLIGEMDYHATDLYKILLDKDLIMIFLKERKLSRYLRQFLIG